MSHTYIVGGMNGNRHVVGCCCCCHVVRRKMVWLCARQASNRTYAKRGEWEGLEGSASRWVGRFCQFWMEGGQKCTTSFIMAGDCYFVVLCDFCEFCGLNANKRQPGKTVKMGHFRNPWRGSPKGHFSGDLNCSDGACYLTFLWNLKMASFN